MALISATVEAIGDEALTSSIIDRSVTEIQDEIVTSIPQNGLYGCTALTKAVFAGVTNMGNYAMQGCTALQTLDLHQKITFGMDVLKNCSALTALILRSSEAISLRSGDIFGGTPIASGAGYIYVPSALVESYKTATHWKTYANQIRAIEDYPAVCSDLGKVWATRNVNSSEVSYMNGVWFFRNNAGAGEYSADLTKYHSSWTVRVGDIEYVDGVWAITRFNGSNGIYTSTDYKSGWAKLPSTEGIEFSSIEYANGMWVAGAYNSTNGMYYSTDGTTWTQSALAVTSTTTFKHVHYNNGVWVTGNSAGALYYSTDGMTWTKASSYSGGNVTHLYCFDGVWVAVGSYSGAGYWSTDGMTWTKFTNISATIRDVVYGAGVWVAATSTGIYYSVDGATWSISNITTDYRSLAYTNGLWVAGPKSSAKILYSTDAKTWVETDTTMNGVTSIVATEDAIVCCQSKRYAYSLHKM